MRVFLTKPELKIEAGRQLFDLAVRIASDGKLDLEEIKELRRWLRANKDVNSVVAIGYLNEVMVRIVADGVIDRDELLELHLAIERVIPKEDRSPIIEARKVRDRVRRERMREQRRIEKERDKKERNRIQQEEHIHQMRLRHSFTKVAGVTFQNDDGSERQKIIKRCKSGEQLVLRHAPNGYSLFATKVLRMNGEQLGNAPEYLAERICDEIEDGYNVVGVLVDVTGGTWEKPILGANFAVFYFASDVSKDELQRYVNNVLAAGN